MDFPLPDHDWAEICRAGRPAAVAYVCAACGERRPRGRAVMLSGELSADRRDELEQAGCEVVESPYVPPGQIIVMDGRLCPVGPDEGQWCGRSAATS